MRIRWPLLGLLLLLIVAPACGQAKKENEQLKAQLAAVQKENVALKGEAAGLRADTEGLRQQVEALTREKQGLQEQLQAAEARAAAKPGTRPPLRPRKPS